MTWATGPAPMCLKPSLTVCHLDNLRVLNVVLQVCVMTWVMGPSPMCLKLSLSRASSVSAVGELFESLFGEGGGAVLAPSAGVGGKNGYWMPLV